MLRNAHKRKDPVCYYEDNFPRGKSFTISLATIIENNQDNSNNELLVILDLYSKNNSSERSEEKNCKLERIFKRLHPSLVTQDQERLQKYDPVTLLTIDSLNNLAWGDRSILHRCMVALSYGETMNEIEMQINKSNRVEKTIWNNIIKANLLYC